MSDRDELREFWTDEGAGIDPSAGVLLAVVERKTRRFDHMIGTRNLVECAAAALVAMIFSYQAYAASANGLSRAGDGMVAAGAAWVIYYVIRYGRGPARPDPSQDLARYVAALTAQYDHQIGLLATVKYWYLLPLYAGLLVGTVGRFLERARDGTLGVQHLLEPLTYTTVVALVWWLNEAKGVARLKAERMRLLSMTDQMAQSTEPS